MRGSDNVVAQGFKYWKSTHRNNMNATEASAHHAPAIPTDAMTMEANGQVMTAELTGLDYESTYNYVAFMTTSEGETYYGEVQTFNTGADTTPVQSVHVEEGTVKIVARYDLQGRRLAAPKRGLNILRISNGSVRKVVVK